MKHKIYLAIIALSVLLACTRKNTKSIVAAPKMDKLEVWNEGYLDIHHINTGNGDNTFMILPDGTTLLFDAGILDKEAFEKKWHPLKATTTVPSDSLSAAEWISLYIKKILPHNTIPKIDYALISHFHGDHYGSLVELGNLIPIKKIIDRNYPNYDFPLDIKEHQKDNSLFTNYLNFIETSEVTAESLIPGSNTQLKLKYAPMNFSDFEIRNVKSNATIWTGKENETFDYFSATDMTSYYKGGYNENPLSLALKISYGKFDYFTGGDNTGLQGYNLPKWFDVETPMAKAVGKIEVTTLNHHSNRDATNDFFVKTLNPKVVVQQSWCSDHPGQEVYQRLIYKDSLTEDRVILATNMHPETLVTYGPWFKNNYKSIQGHIVIRVYEEGYHYEVFVLDDTSTELTIKQRLGPYQSN